MTSLLSLCSCICDSSSPVDSRKLKNNLEGEADKRKFLLDQYYSEKKKSKLHTTAATQQFGISRVSEDPSIKAFIPSSMKGSIFSPLPKQRDCERGTFTTPRSFGHASHFIDKSPDFVLREIELPNWRDNSSFKGTIQRKFDLVTIKQDNY